MVKNSALFLYVLILLGFQLYIYQLSPQILGFATNVVADDLYGLVNQERVDRGLPALARNPKLEKAALNKAKDMFAKNYWAHYAPDGSTTPWKLITQAGYTYKYAGENLAMDFDTSVAVVTAWIASPSHRANLLNGNYKDIGMAAINGTLLGEETTLVVQLLGTPISAAAAVGASSAEEVSQPSGGTAGAESSLEEAKPAIVVGPTENGKAAISQPAELASVGITPLDQIVKTLNPVSSPKTVPLGFGFFLLGLFALDELSMLRGGLTRSELKRTVENIGHMAILGLLMVVVWLTKAGGIL